ncbi:MAG TPA: hypothetical protein VMU73_08510 [Gaiellaceae bacterium]|nr:hypothetical protein [Gaiellaceae bacterium]
MRASVALPSSADVAERATAWCTRAAAIAQRRRWWIVGLCILGQWGFLWHEIPKISHNGWLFSDGDDGPWYWTSAWAQTSLHVPITAVGPGWPYLLTPLAAIFGPNMANGLPAVIALNVLVLGPAAVVGMFLLGERIAGRLFGVWCVVLWTLMPGLAIGLYGPTHRTYLVDFFLPTATGLNTLADYPSMVCAIFCAYLVLRAMDSNTFQDGVFAGILLGFLVLLKPANGPLALSAALVLALTLRFRTLGAALVGMVPAVIALTLWKKTGIGHVPLFALSTTREAMGAAAAPLASIAPYFRFDWSHTQSNINALREVFWSLRLLEFLLVAGTVGLIARARARGALIVGWFLLFVLIKATVSYAGVYDTSVYRFLLPAWPAWVLIVAGVVFCWPIGARKRAQKLGAATQFGPTRRWLPIAAAVLLAAGPLAVAIAASPIPADSVVQINLGSFTGPPVPVISFRLTAHRVAPHTVRLTWADQGTPGTLTSYQVYKGTDSGCTHLEGAAPVCFLDLSVIGMTKKTSFEDNQAEGRVEYRVGFGPGPRLQPDTPALLLVSKPATVTR